MKIKNKAFVQLTILLSSSLVAPILSTSVTYAEDKKESGMSAVAKAIGKKMNAYNSDVPAGFADGLIKSNGSATYDVGTQALITYSILRDKWGSGKSYGDLYKTGEDEVKSFKDAAPGIKVKKMGTDTVVNELANKSNDDNSNQSKQTKADLIKTSGFPTDQSVKERARWLAANDKVNSLAKAVGQKLGDNANKAVSLEGNRCPWVLADYGTDISDGAVGNDVGSYVKSVFEDGKRLASQVGNKSSSLNKARWRIAYTIDSSSATSNPFSDKGGIGVYSPKNKKFANANLSEIYSGHENSDRQKFEDLYSVELASELLSKNEFKSKKSFSKYLNNLNANDLTDSKFNQDYESYFDKRMNAESVKSGGAIAFSLYEGRQKTTSANEAANDGISMTSSLNPYSVKDHVTGAGGEFYENYQNHMNKKVNVNVTDEMWKTYKAFMKNKNENADEVNDATSGVRVLSWSPAVLFNEKAFKGGGEVGRQNNTTGNNTTPEGGFIKLNSNGQYETINGTIISEKSGNVLGKYKETDISLGGGGKDTVITNGNKISDITVVGNGQYSKVAKDWKTDKDIYGYDAYGNIIDGQKFKVVVPYWSNDTVKVLKNDVKYAANTAKIPPISHPSAEANVTNAQLGSVAAPSTKAYKNAKNVRDAIRNSNPSSNAKFINTVNKAVGSSGSNLSDKGAASLAIVITAGTKKDVKAYNIDFLKKASKSKQLYLGESIKAKDKDDDSKNTSLYTASDIIQRVGLMTDIGMYDIFRKTIVSTIVNTYNNSIIQEGWQNIFYTDTFNSDGLLSQMGMSVYVILVLVLEFVIIVITGIQYLILRTVGPSEFFKRTGKFMLFVIVFNLLHTLENLALNKPVELIANRPVKQEFIIDEWSKLKQQQRLNNVFYSGLFGDNNARFNQSTNYMIPFNTSTTNQGAIIPSVSDPASSQGKKANSERLNNGEVDPTQKYNTTFGNGKVSFGTQYKFKKIYVSSLDLMNWASVMARQKLSSDGTISKDSGDYEKPSEGYAPGKEPLFVWLAKDYKPILGSSDSKKNDKDKDDSKDVKDGLENDSSDSEKSKSSNSGEYGETRNPADTTPKSALGSGTTNESIDNSELYKNYDKYAEYAVNTKHFASKASKMTGDEDSSGGLLTASQAFLELWMQVFDNSGAGRDPGDAESFTALMNFAQAMNGDMSSQTQVGTNKNDLNINTVGSSGRNDLINELSMTKKQRNALNGGDDGRFSDSAKNMIHAFKIPAGKSDYFDLDKRHSIIDRLIPYQKGRDQNRDSTIYSVNKKVLNNYISNYSVVRAAIDPSGANSTSGDSNNKSTNKKHTVDPFTMAEDHAVALDMFFTLNKELGYKMFPTGYNPKTVSLDSWNRMMFIPMGDLSTALDNSQYNQDELTPSQVKMQDNVAEYLSLRSNLFVLTLFMIMNYMLIAFGWFITMLFKYAMPIVVFFQFIKHFVLTGRSKGTLKGLLSGVFGATIIFGIMKAGLAGIVSLRSSQMNNAYILRGGYTDNNTLVTVLAIIIYLISSAWFIMKVYMPMLKNNFSNLGATDDGKFFGNLGNKAKDAWNHGIAKKYANKSKDKFMKVVSAGLGVGALGTMYLKRHIAKQTKKIDSKLFPEDGKFKSIKKKIDDMGLIQTISDGGWFSRYKSKDGLSSRINDMLNARYGRIKKTISGGLNPEELNGLSDGDMIDETKPGKARWNLGKDNDLINAIKDTGILPDGFRLDDNGNLVSEIDNSDMLKKPSGRKELFDPFLRNISNRLNSEDGLVGKQHRLGKHFIDVKDNGYSFSVPVNDKIGISPERLDALLNDSKFNDKFNVIKEPLTVNGRRTSGTLKVIPKDGASINDLQRLSGQFVGRHFRSEFNNAMNVGGYANDIKGMTVPGMDIVDGNLVYDSRSPEQVAAASAIQNRLNETVVRKNRKLNDLSNGISDYVVDGDSSGIGNPDVESIDPNVITKRFTTNNAYNAKHGIKGLMNIASMKTNNGLATDAKNITNRFEQGLSQVYGSKGNLANAYMSALNKTNIDKTPQINDAMKDLRNTMKALGPTSYQDANDRQKRMIDQSMDRLKNSLAESGNLNTIQNVLSSNAGQSIPGARELSDFRSHMLRKSGVPEAMFNRMTVDQLANLSAIARNLGNGYDVDDNGIVKFNINKDENSQLMNKRLSEMLRLLS